MDLPADLKFADETARATAMEEYAKGPDANPDEITRMMNAPVETVDTTPIEEVEEDSFGGAPAPEPPAPSQAPAPMPAPGQPPANTVDATMNRAWQISEKDIPKDTYFDKKENRVRPFITQKDPQDLFKTVIHSQKRIHYLEDVLLPQEREAAAAEARAQITAELERTKAELEQLRKGTTAAPASPPQQPAAGSMVPTPTGNIQDTALSLQAAMDSMKGIDPKDAIEHTDKLMAALSASVNHINNLTAHMGKVQEETGTVNTRFQKIEADRATEAQHREADARNAAAKDNWARACTLVDSFAQNNADFKSEYGSIDQTFADATRDSVVFHTQIAGLMFNKHPNQVTNQEQIAASQAYLRGDEKLLQTAQQYGIVEPKNYRAWVELDQVDAMRTGMYRDPVSKQWIQLSDPVSKKPVHLGDMETSYGRYLDVSGKRQQRIAALLKQQQSGITDAITRRDKGITSMDTNKLGSDGSGNALTEQQAYEIINGIDVERAQIEYYKTGDKALMDRLNQALVRIGNPPIELLELDTVRAARK